MIEGYLARAGLADRDRGSVLAPRAAERLNLLISEEPRSSDATPASPTCTSPTNVIVNVKYYREIVVIVLLCRKTLV